MDGCACTAVALCATADGSSALRHHHQLWQTEVWQHHVALIPEHMLRKVLQQHLQAAGKPTVPVQHVDWERHRQKVPPRGRDLLRLVRPRVYPTVGFPVPT